MSDQRDKNRYIEAVWRALVSAVALAVGGGAILLDAVARLNSELVALANALFGFCLLVSLQVWVRQRPERWVVSAEVEAYGQLRALPREQRDRLRRVLGGVLAPGSVRGKVAAAVAWTLLVAVLFWPLYPGRPGFGVRLGGLFLGILAWHLVGSPPGTVQR